MVRLYRKVVEVSNTNQVLSAIYQLHLCDATPFLGRVLYTETTKYAWLEKYARLLVRDE
jgi:hypothetical protein